MPEHLRIEKEVPIAERWLAVDEPQRPAAGWGGRPSAPWPRDEPRHSMRNATLVDYRRRGDGAGGWLWSAGARGGPKQAGATAVGALDGTCSLVVALGDVGREAWRGASRPGAFAGKDLGAWCQTFAIKFLFLQPSRTSLRSGRLC